MSENEFKFDGIEYVAVADDLDAPDGCALCAFDKGKLIKGCIAIRRPGCSFAHREDKQDIHWEKK